MGKTAGEILAEIMQAKAQGKDTQQLRQDFEQQSRAQLGGCCTSFVITEGTAPVAEQTQEE